MAKQISGTMGTIAKDIICWDYDSEQSQKDEIVAKIVAYGLNYMSNEYDVENKNVNVNTKLDNKINSRRTASFNLVDSMININGNVVSSRFDYGNDLVSILHETFHFGQSKGGDKKDKLYSNKSFLSQSSFPEFVVRAVYGKGIYEGITEAKFVNIDDITCDCAKQYISAKYYTDPVEIAARKFSYEATQSIIDYYNNNKAIFSADGIMNNIRAKKNIKTIKKELKESVENDKINQFYYNNLVEKYDDYYKELVVNFRNNIMKVDENGKNYLDKLAEYDNEDWYASDKINGPIYDYLVEGLMIDYDEDFTCKLTDSLLKNPKSNWETKRYNLYTILKATDYNFSDEQYDKFVKLERSNGKGKTLDILRQSYSDMTIES